MKKSLLILVLAMIVVCCLVFASCGFFPSLGCNGKHTDANADGICDVCKLAITPAPCTEHKDENGDNKCDLCNEAITNAECTNHVDTDHNGVCDNDGCDYVYIAVAHTDGNYDMVCDSCGRSSLSTAAELTALGNSLALGTKTTEYYFIKGTLSAISNTTYGNTTITDEAGNSIIVWGMYNTSNQRYDAMTTKPQQGDVVLLKSVVYNYNNNGSSKIELEKAIWIKTFANTTCNNHVDADHNGVCDNDGCSATVAVNHVDQNADGYCDGCNVVMPKVNCGNHVDANHDGICDKFACQTSGLTVTHADANHDGTCDVATCGATGLAYQHADLNGDDKCDTCGKDMPSQNCGNHIDADHNGVCDNSNCDVDGLQVTHADANHDGTCDVAACGATGLTVTHTDDNADGYCDADGCNHVMPKVNCGNHVDSNHDGVCDKFACQTSGLAVSHVDTDHNGTCDVAECGTTGLTVTHADDDCNGVCDVTTCGATVQIAHIDNNNDDLCDKCNAQLSNKCAHVDDNDDGICDLCKQGSVTVDFYSINDFHGATEKIAQIGTYLLGEKDENSVFINSGDMWQGSMQSNANYGKLLTDCMDYIGFDAFVLGNHEFDWGLEKVEARKAGSTTPFLGANIYKWNNSTKTWGEFCSELAQEYVVKTLDNGVKVGIVGVIGPAQITSICSTFVGTIGFKDPSLVIPGIVDKLRNDLGCDVVVASVHSDQEDISTDSTFDITQYVDAVFCAHTHDKETSYTNGVPFVQGGAYGNYVSKVTLTVDINKNVTCSSGDYSNVSFNSSWAKNSAIQQMVNNSNASIEEEANEVLATTNGTLNSGTGVEHLLAHAMATYATESGYDIALAMTNTQRSAIASGNITYSALYEAIPFDNFVYIAKVSGANIIKQAAYSKIWRVTTDAIQNSSSVYYYVAVLDYNLFHVNTSRDYDRYYSAHNNGFEPVALTKTGYDVYHYRYITRDFLREIGSVDASYYNSDTSNYTNVDLLTQAISTGGDDTCVNHVDTDHNGVCDNDNCQYTYHAIAHTDNDYDMVCDSCGNSSLSTAAELTALGNSLALGTKTTEYYFIKGTLSAISNTTYGNTTITDEAGNSIIVYGMYNTSNQRYDAMTTKPQQGDVVLLKSVVYNYNNYGSSKIELEKAIYVKTISSASSSAANVMPKQNYNAANHVDYDNILIDAQDNYIASKPTNGYLRATGLQSQGTYKALVIPVQFPNDEFTAAELSRLNTAFNDTTGATGWHSVKSYYQTASYGKLNITFDIVQNPVEVSKNYEDYNLNSTIATDVLREVLLDLGNLDLSKYDVDNDGYADAVYLVYSAPIDYDLNRWAFVYWDFSGNTYGSTSKKVHYYFWASVDFLDYTSENADPGYAISGLKIDATTYVHETGHLLGLDDYYDYSEGTGSDQGLGQADMMDATMGDHNPYSKLLLGWIKPTVVTTAQTVTLKPHTATENGGVIMILLDYNGTYFSEYLLVELYTETNLNQLHGSVGQLYGGKNYGVRVYHVSSAIDSPFSDSYGSFTTLNNSVSNKPLIKLVEADGQVDFGGAGVAKAADLWQTGGKLSAKFPDYTRNDGKKINFDISFTSVSSSSATVQITF